MSKSGPDKKKQELHKELENVLKAAVSSRTSKEAISSETAQALCNVIEAVFIHGLRDPFFLKGSRYAKYPEPNFWPFVSKFSHRSVITHINALSQIKNEIGRARAWVRIVLNEGSLQHYIELLIGETTALNQFYNDYAFLRDADLMEKSVGFLRGLLSKLVVNAPTNSSFLNSWTPTPLILAGLVSGKALRVGDLIARRTPSRLDADEVGVAALDVFDVPSPSRHTNKASTSKVEESDDDARSIYSHNSRVIGPHETPPTPVRKGYTLNPQSPTSADPLIVNRRQMRPRRSSSDSCSHSLSETAEDEEKRRTPIFTLGSPPEVTNEQNLHSETRDSGIDPDSPKAEEKPQEKEKKETVESSGTDVPEPSTPPSLHEELALMEKEKDEQGEKEEPLPETIHGDESPIEEKMEPADEQLLLSTSTISTPKETRSSSFSEESNFGNSLQGRSWASRKNSEMDSPTSSSPTPVSFGHALRKAIETHEKQQESPILALTEESEEGEQVMRLAPAKELERHSLSGIEPPADTLTRLSRVAVEKGLDSQEFRCAACCRSIGSAYGELCGLDALYYCVECFADGGEMPIPGRVLKSWDHAPRAVSRRARVFLEAHGDRPIFNIDTLSPSLYEHCKTLAQVLEQRRRLQLASMYLFGCKQSVAQDMKKRLWPREYLASDLHLYSYEDLLSVPSGLLEKQLNELVKHAVGHVQSCALCRQKGFVCEICGDPRVIFPFEIETTYRCGACFSVFHASCFANRHCPKCRRRSEFLTQVDDSHLLLD